ncbi:MAG: acetylornithine deacetylase, partial [Pseudoxanthomonas sp.]|nr:acetylornithine deacetylase [Pseudoxanthomonas sp.]
MTELLASTFAHLEKLVSFDTRNPPRAIAAEGGIFEYLRSQLPGFRVEVVDHGAGAVASCACTCAAKPRQV